MSATEEAFVFPAAGERLVGILHRPADEPHRRGVVLIVGGPQYRVGSHRQFVLLARRLSDQGFAVLRFDCRGMGDSEGEGPDFERADPDIGAAVDALLERVPALREVVLWGLCDAASAAMLYAHDDARITGLVLLNPWVRTQEGEAKTYIRHYYLGRLLSGDFWRHVLSGGFRPLAALRSLGANALTAMGVRAKAPGGESRDTPFPIRMREGLNAFDGRVLVILSGNDLTAAEYRDLVAADPQWQRALDPARTTSHELADATHTFSRRAWRIQVEDWSAEWLNSW